MYPKQWLKHCGKRNSDPFYPSVNSVLQSATGLKQKALSHSALNSARTALPCISICSESIISKHPLICRCSAGVFQEKSRTPRYRVVWDAKVLVNNLGPNSELSLEQLTHKTVSLLALVTAQHVQFLHLLKLAEMRKTEGCFLFGQVQIKQSRPGTALRQSRLIF